MFIELSRLIITTCYVVGPEITFDWVLHHIDVFFDAFVKTYGELSLEREDFHRLELASELVVPIIQLVGAEAFYTAVPSLNPRLDVAAQQIIGRAMHLTSSASIHTSSCIQRRHRDALNTEERYYIVAFHPMEVIWCLT